MKKNAQKSKPKFLHCFRPVVDMDMVLESKGVRRVRTVAKKEVDKKPPPLTKTMSLDREFSPVMSENSKNMPPRSNRTFSRVIKAVVFETILAKRARDRKGYRQDSFGSSKRSFSMRREASSLDLGNNELVKTEEKTKPNSETSSHSRSSSTSSSSISRSSSGSESKRMSKNLSESAKQSVTNRQEAAVKSKNMETGSSRFNSGIYLLLISLGITVFWGRVFAILVTSIWLYFFPAGRYNASNFQPENVLRKWSEAECRDNKKRVIMEGLIERKNHHSHRDRGALNF